MKTQIFAVVGVLALLVAALPAGIAGARSEMPPLPLPVDIDAKLKNTPAPVQNYAEGELPAGIPTTAPQCSGSGDPLSLTITITSFDPANPGAQDVVFWKETASTATGNATLWVAWDFLATQWGRQDAITCEQLAYLQSTMDHIVASDVNYFGEYVQRPAGNANIDVMIYNIVDEGYFVEGFPTYIAGFFWSSVNEAFDRNMIFIDSYDWVNRLGPDVARPYLYEGTVAHELQHLIHNDHDPDEDSWVDEGLADLAQYFAGFGHDDGHVVYYLAYHRTPLTVWGGGLESYGASYLFQLYLLENFGTQVGGVWDNAWTRGLVDEQANSIEGIQNATGAIFNDLYDAWIVANYLDDPTQTGAGGFPIGYNTIDLTPFIAKGFSPWSIERSITDIYGADHNGNVPLPRYWGGYKSGTVEYPVGDAAPYAPIYGLYKGMEPEMDIYVRGAAHSGVAPHEGSYEVAAGSSNMLTDRMLALNLPVGGTLSFWTWYDIETEWDYGFVEASTDGGATWAPIPGDITSYSINPNNSTAWANSLVGGLGDTDAAITGNSGGWVEATFPLPAASGVLVRFSYYTDEATLGQGWFIDALSVDGFSDGFEGGSADWSLGGWTRTTGLFDNDWIAGFVNPIYNKGQFQQLDWDYLDGVPYTGADGTLYELITGAVDTSKLNKDEAVVFFSNRPDVSPFAAGYRTFVEKGDAAP